MGDGPIQVTDEYGSFEFQTNQPLTFLVDGVEIGSVAQGLVRVTPPDFGAEGLNVARFLQSIDTTPTQLGIELNGVNLPDTPINFLQGRDSFTADPAVAQAIAAAASAGATGVLVSETDARNHVLAATNRVLEHSFIQNLAVYPVTSGTDNEPCVCTVSRRRYRIQRLSRRHRRGSNRRSR